ncbi:hypothetical protein NW739_06555 [Mycoplasmopsis felis]|uniref:hypothetical protein n=1 Tax=Mycoplasmopsis felis TaxID=33923 RepID=UPI0021E0E426|nr:hypothetical protein [Mycoplasmopsis felis]MCU9940303.1 hypothetical protein [Mycoplasmopsis felis]
MFFNLFKYICKSIILIILEFINFAVPYDWLSNEIKLLFKYLCLCSSYELLKNDSLINSSLEFLNFLFKNSIIFCSYVGISIIPFSTERELLSK